MRIAYCTNVRLPSERAHGHQVAQVCDALASLGHAVTVFAPYRRNSITEDYWTYYGADRTVQVEHLGSFDPIDHPLFPGPLALWTLNALLRSALRRALRRALRHALRAAPQPSRFDLLYTRTPALLSALLATGIPVALELHSLPRRGRRAFVARCGRCRLVVCLTSPMRDTLVSWGVPRERTMVEGDAVDLRRFASLPSRDDARRRWSVPSGRIVVGYVGRLKTLGMEKGVADLLTALRELRSDRRFFGFVVGGPEADRKQYEAQAQALGLTAEEVLFTGEVPAADVPPALAACDVLAMPFPDLPHYRHNMSPLKMFEYMAAGRPIITSDLPTVRDVLSEETAIFCVPGDAASLAQSLVWIKDHPTAAATRAAAAYELVRRHTWPERMRRILATATLSP